MKKAISVILALLLALSCTVGVSASGSGASLYTIYGDGMLFQHSEDVVLRGTAADGSRITAALYKNGEIKAEAASVAADGKFELSFRAPAGGYDKYKIVLSCNGVVFETLDDVVFGLLWLASGQSNMQYPLSQEKTGAVMYEKREKLGDWLRVLLVPAVPEYKGRTDLVPAEPQADIAGAQWTNGNNEAAYSMSAVAYFFAKELNEQYKMPVGVLNVPLGGSVISSWISREAIDSDSTVKGILEALNEYYPLDEWNEAQRSAYYDMTSNYNLKIEALGCFRPDGMIWYQGESDIIYQKTPAEYAALFNLMQKSYSAVFGYENELIPVIYSQCAAYEYIEKNGIDLVRMNAGFAEMQKSESDSRAAVAIYDVPLTYLPALGAIHPDTKKEIGERMAFCADGLVYGGGNDYTSPYVESYEIADGRINVTLGNVGDGLKADGMLKGFAVAGNDGIFVNARAEIINKNTVSIYNEKVKEPVSASYAYCLGNMNANLYASSNGEKTLPVSPFVVNAPENAAYFAERQWADCDSDKAFHLVDDSDTKEYDTWSAKNALLEFSRGDAYSGNAGLGITADGDFSISPVINGKDGLSVFNFDDEGYDYSQYGKIVFAVRNNGNEDTVFNGIKISCNAKVWYSTTGSGVVIPADGKWYEITADIDHLYLYGVNYGVKLANDKLKSVSGLEFMFSGKNADISVDSFSLTPETGVRDSRFDYTKLFNIINIIKMFLAELIKV